jgi:hypothetical protein
MQSPHTAQDVPRTVRNRMPLAFLSAIPIAILVGLIGLGGAEFRLPVLAGPLGYSARKAVPLNLAVSLTTIIASLLIRGRTLSLTPLGPFWPAMLAMIAGAVVAAFFGAGLSGRLSNEQLERVILVLPRYRLRADCRGLASTRGAGSTSRSTRVAGSSGGSVRSGNWASE